MRATAHSLRRNSLVLAVVAALVIALGFSSATHAADEPDWKAAVVQIPETPYTKDAQTYTGEPGVALKPHLGDDLGAERLRPVLDDLASRYFDGARLRSTEDGLTAYTNLQHLDSYLKSSLSGGKVPSGDMRTAHIAALVGSLTGGRQVADAAIQDVAVTVAPFQRTDGTAAMPPPPGFDQAVVGLADARAVFAAADGELRKGLPEPAIVHFGQAWEAAFQALAGLGITYEGDHDSDGVTDVVELRFGASPLVVDSDADGLTDRFEIHELAGWTAPNSRDTDLDGVLDGDEDIDGDGLTNLAEQNLGTAPGNADTDGDGVSDGAEVARGTNPLVADARGPPLAGDMPPIETAPTPIDTDGDGLDDLAEDDEESDPAKPDTDGDGLSDGAEVDEIGTNPASADSDGDGLSDGYEMVHAVDQGLDPVRPDEQVSKWTYVTDFLLGLFAGDFAPRDSMAWLSGYLCSGGLSLIPVVGWILGGIADIRDTVAGLIHGDWVGTGLSILGVVPYAGDAVAIPGKAAKFAARFTHRIDTVIRFIARYDKISDGIKTLAIKAIMLGDYGKLIEKNLTEASILRLARGERTSLKRLAAAMGDINHVVGDTVPFFRTGRAGERHVIRDSSPAGTRTRGSASSGRPECPIPTRRGATRTSCRKPTTGSSPTRSRPAFPTPRKSISARRTHTSRTTASSESSWPTGTSCHTTGSTASASHRLCWTA